MCVCLTTSALKHAQTHTHTHSYNICIHPHTAYPSVRVPHELGGTGVGGADTNALLRPLRRLEDKTVEREPQRESARARARERKREIERPHSIYSEASFAEAPGSKAFVPEVKNLFRRCWPTS